MSGQGMPPSALPSQGVPPMQVSSQGMMAPVLPVSVPGHESSTGPSTQSQAMPLKFDIGHILSVIRNNMSAVPQALEWVQRFVSL